jgi:hypothetical protein
MFPYFSTLMFSSKISDVSKILDESQLSISLKEIKLSPHFLYKSYNISFLLLSMNESFAIELEYAGTESNKNKMNKIPLIKINFNPL